MLRKARIDTTGAIHHIIVRGIERGKTFRNGEDRSNFIERFDEIIFNRQTACFAWALLPNHVHLLLRTGLKPISTVMQRLLTGVELSHRLKISQSALSRAPMRGEAIAAQNDFHLENLTESARFA